MKINQLMTIQEVADYTYSELKKIIETDPELGDELSDLALKPNETFSEEDLLHLKEKVGSNLPADFVELISKYDFGDLTLRQVSFGYQTNYFSFLMENNDSSNHYYDELKEANVLYIGGGDPYRIMLSLENGAVYATDYDITERIQVAPSFKLFIQGLGTACYAFNNDIFEEFLQIAKNEFGETSLSFWEFDENDNLKL